VMKNLVNMIGMDGSGTASVTLVSWSQRWSVAAEGAVASGEIRFYYSRAQSSSFASTQLEIFPGRTIGIEAAFDRDVKKCPGERRELRTVAHRLRQLRLIFQYEAIFIIFKKNKESRKKIDDKDELYRDI
jgi:hypothetical protein